MNGKELQVRTRRPVPSVLLLAFMLSLTGFAERTLVAATSAAPRVRFDPGHAPDVPPDVPPQVLVGEDFTFKVRFKNAAPADIGYGPFIDLVLDAGGANITKNPPCACDGMTFVKANMIDVNGGPVPVVSYQSVAPPCTSSLPVSPNHPFLSSGVQPVLLSPGSQLVTIELPFGSFDPSQPEIVVEVTAHVSKLADANQPARPFKIYARGGFRYGLDALDNGSTSGDWPVLSDVKIPGNPPSTLPSNQQTDPTQWAAQAQTDPTVMIVSKRYLGPENETVTGPNFIKSWELTLDIATGQTVNNLTVIDFLLTNVAYHQVDSVAFSSSSSHSSPCFVIPPSQAPPPNTNPIGSANWLTFPCVSITGGTHPLPPAVPIHDATIVFEFFVPEKSGDGFPILEPTSCAPVPLVNGVEAEGTWLGPTPPDACDTYQVITSIMYPDPPLNAKCMAIQKSVAVINDTGAPGPTPGDTLQYSLNFQISDFKTAGNLKIQDFLSDGQTLVPGSLKLLVSDQCGTTPATGIAGAIPSNAFTQTTACSSVGLAPGAPPLFTTLNIDVSAAMIALGSAPNPPGPFRQQHGILTGGHAFAPTPLLTTPALGTITFQTVIQDKYVCPVTSPHDLFVDKDDPLTNTVTMTADILTNNGTCSTTPSAAGFTAQDDSQTAILIPTDFLAKTVYAVVRGSTQICGPNTTPCPSQPEVMPFDQVTFRLTKTIPSSDAESLTIQDWLPLPKFLVAGTTFSNTQCGIPAVGASCLGPSLPALSLTLPVVPTYPGSTPPSSNSFTFTYGTFNDPANQPRVIDLLFTRVVTNTPAADGLYVTNEAQECESNTFGVTFCQSAIAQVHVREPALKITKGIVAATNPNAIFSPLPAGPVAFHAVGTGCPRFSGTINSTNLASAPINSDVSSIDANDCVTFAIVVENTGGSPAYDVKLRELFPPGPLDIPDCFIPDFTTLCVTDGTGTPLPFTPGTAFHANLPIALQNPLPGVTSPAGSNIAVITFDACVVANIKPHCCDNVARLENYASTSGGPNFVDGGFGGPFQDTARLCVLPRATKSITTTSEAHTPGTPSGPPLSPEQLAVGEIIRYHLDVVVPESTSPSSYQLQDLLPAGLSYLGNLIVAPLPPGVTASNFPPLVTGAIGTCSGGTVTFSFGNVTNTNPNTPAQEHISLDFNALVCNVSSNQNGRLLNNSFSVVVDGQQVTASNSVAAVVVEPKITIAKTAAVPSLTAGAAATYTITLTNNGTATAFDVHLTDHLPSCLTNLAGVQVSTSATNNSTATTLDLVIGSIPLNGTVTIHYTATVSCVDCSKLVNTANVTWTSLPGPFGTTVNPTTSPTPGTSGSATGERDGSGAVNNYVASATASLCCMLMSHETISCNPNGTFTYTVTVTNFSNSNISEVGFFPPAGITVTPNLISLNSPVPPGGSITETFTISGPGAVSGAAFCSSVGIAVPAGGWACLTDHCITLPNCCAEPPYGMVAWWPLDETSGTVVADIVGNNNGTAKPGPINSIGPASQPGKVNNGLVFCGPPLTATPTFVTVADKSTLNFGTAQSFSIDAWINPSNGFPMIVDKLNWPNASAGYRFYVDDTHRLKLDIAGGAFFGIAPLTPGNWYHVAATVDRALPRVTFYINGTPEVVGGPSSFLNASSPALDLLIGGTRETQLPSGCKYIVDEIEIFNRALSQAEIQGIFNAGAAGKCKCVSPPPGMVSWWPGDSNANDIADGNDGTLQGNATFAKGMVLSAFSFAAASDYVSVPSATNLNFGPAGSGGDISIDAWIETSSSETVLPIVDKRDLPADQSIGYIFFLYNGELAFQLGDGTFFNYISSGPDLRDGKFHHVAVTVNRTSHTGGTLYADGNVVLQFDPTNRPASLTNDKPLLIGHHAGDPTIAFVGLIDEVEIFNRALSQKEIVSIFSAGSAGKCTSAVICVTSFQDPNGNGVQDPGELALPGSTFTVTDQNGIVIGTITAPACLTVPRPGNYTIQEQVPPGWLPTQANPQTVTIVPGQVVNLGFGNRRVLRHHAVLP
jgi:uncharacterized repeat protein (TIGR01451 family)